MRSSISIRFRRRAAKRRGSRPPVTAADIRAVRARRRELVIPESFEWIEQTAPEMAAAAAGAGLVVQTHPLMVLSAPPLAPPRPADVTVRVVRDRFVILACEDNLVRGASGVAVQNFNRMYGFDERAGLL